MSDTTTNHDLNFNSELLTNELADGELDDRDLEAINGGCGCIPIANVGCVPVHPKPRNPLEERSRADHKLFNMGISRYYPR
ncbi:hypothetical protein [Microcoleus sp. herbarium13]|uniref:hypothetical protein n=1 Tax=Microcoleus sp. herbarium13 TaxID=3055438 RepID=UPI002FCFC08C